eukprot:4748993-Pleurochrysis_carterae.AAC.2
MRRERGVKGNREQRETMERERAWATTDAGQLGTQEEARGRMETSEAANIVEAAGQPVVHCVRTEPDRTSRTTNTCLPMPFRRVSTLQLVLSESLLQAKP